MTDVTLICPLCQRRIPAPTPPVPVAPSPVRLVFDYWRQVMDRPRAHLDRKRAQAIAARLQVYSVADLQQAIDGCRATPFNMGANPAKRLYNDISLICRDAQHVEDFTQQASAHATQARELDTWIQHGASIDGECRRV